MGKADSLHLIDGQKIKQLRKEKGLTLKEFADSIGVSSASQVSNWENNKHVPVLASVMKIKEIYQLDLLTKKEQNSYAANNHNKKSSFVINDIGLDSQNSDLDNQNKVLVTMPADARALAGEHSVDFTTEDGSEIGHFMIPRDFLAQFDLVGLNRIKIFEVEGDSMEPDLKAGEKAIVDVSAVSLKDGAIYLLRIEGKTYVKRVFQHDEGLMLVSKNPLYPNRLIPNGTEIEVVGRVARKVEFRVHKL